MAPLLKLTVHPSQFPDALQNELTDCLRERDIHPKFLYESVRQAARWLALHNAFSPSQTDPSCSLAYQAAFSSLARQVRQNSKLCVVGLGCGTGQKEAGLLQELVLKAGPLTYVPVDVSVPLVIQAAGQGSEQLQENACHPLVCDLAMANDLPQVLTDLAGGDSQRILTCFGLIPNMEAGALLPRVAGAMSSGDYLILSANLAPGPDYARGVEKILPLYDNGPTRDWLITFLLEVGLDPEDGNLAFSIEVEPNRVLRRVEGWFRLRNAKVIDVHGTKLAFSAGDRLRLFFSYRHTPPLLRRLLADHGLRIIEEFIVPSHEEGVFLARRVAA